MPLADRAHGLQAGHRHFKMYDQGRSIAFWPPLILRRSMDLRGESMMNKKVKKTVFVLLLTVLLLCSCDNSKKPEPFSELFEDPPLSEPGEAHSLHQCSSETPMGFFSIELLNDQYANIAFIDYSEKKQIFLCSRPECTHDTGSCLSVIPLDADLAVPAIFSEMDCLFFLQTGTSRSALPHLAVAALNGQDRKTVVEFPNNYVLSPDLYADGRSFYLIAEEIDSEHSTSCKNILQIDPIAEKYTTLYTYPQNAATPSIAGGFGRELVISSYQIDPSGKMLLCYDFFNVDTRSFDPEKKMILDFETTGSFWEENCYYEIHYENEEIRKVNYPTQETHVYSYSEIFRRFSDLPLEHDVAVFAEDRDLIRIEATSSDPEDPAFYEFLLNTQTQEFGIFDLRKELKDDVITVLAKDEAQDLLLVCKDWKATQTVSEIGIPIFIFSPQYAFLSKSDFINSIDNYIPVPSEVYPNAWE